MTTTLFVLPSPSVTQLAQTAESQILHMTAGELKARIGYKICSNSGFHSVANGDVLVECGAVTG